MKVTLKNGLVVEGTPEQVTKVALTFGETLGNDGVHYMSNSHGLVRIDAMDEKWLRNALAKRIREIEDSGNDPTTTAMFRRLSYVVASRLVRQYR